VAEFKKRVAAKIKDGYVEVAAVGPKIETHPSHMAPTNPRPETIENFGKYANKLGFGSAYGETGLVYRGNVKLSGFDIVEDVPEGFAGVIVEGDLDLGDANAFVNYQEEDGDIKFLCVTGNLRVGGVHSEGVGFAHVKGDAHVATYVFANDYGGGFKVEGVTYAPHALENGVGLNIRLPGGAEPINVKELEPDELRAMFVPECFDEDGKFDTNAWQELLDAGKSPLKKAKKK